MCGWGPRVLFEEGNRSPSVTAAGNVVHFRGLPPSCWLVIFGRKVRRLAREETAGMTMIAAAMVPVILLMALILHDVAVAYIARSQAQTAADAAAKAAGLELTPLFGVGSDPFGAARDYAHRNGCELLSCDTDGNGRYLWVTVRVARKADRLFLKPGGAILTATARCYLDLSSNRSSREDLETVSRGERSNT